MHAEKIVQQFFETHLEDIHDTKWGQVHFSWGLSNELCN
jgi:hypothetical protein